MMRASLAAAFLLAGTLSGCNRSTANLPPPPPHGGTAFPLPEGKGFVEVVRQHNRDQPDLTRLLIYFLDAECKPLRSAPTVASFQPRGRGAAPVALKPTGESGPAKTGELASAPFGDPGDIAGVLSAEIESKRIAVAINIR